MDGLGIEPRTFRRTAGISIRRTQDHAKRTLYQLSHTPLWSRVIRLLSCDGDTRTGLAVIYSFVVYGRPRTGTAGPAQRTLKMWERGRVKYVVDDYDDNDGCDLKRGEGIYIPKTYSTGLNIHTHTRQNKA